MDHGHARVFCIVVGWPLLCVIYRWKGRKACPFLLRSHLGIPAADRTTLLVNPPRRHRPPIGPCCPCCPCKRGGYEDENRFNHFCKTSPDDISSMHMFFAPRRSTSREGRLPALDLPVFEDCFIFNRLTPTMPSSSLSTAGEFVLLASHINQ